MELIAKREQEYLMDLDSEGGYEMDPTVMKKTAQYVDHITRLWIENNGWIGFFLIQFQKNSDTVVSMFIFIIIKYAV